jgi:hypothetical protein
MSREKGSPWLERRSGIEQLCRLSVKAASMGSSGLEQVTENPPPTPAKAAATPAIGLRPNLA